MLEHILFHSSCHWISSSKMELEGIRLRLEKKKKKAKGFLSTFKVSWQPSFILLEPKKKKKVFHLKTSVRAQCAAYGSVLPLYLG